jgi:hypothetical protein
MNGRFPNRYLSLREALSQLKNAIFAGRPDRPAIAKVREQEGDVGDGEATEEAAAELWRAVDRGSVRAMAIDGSRRKVVQLSADTTREIRLLRQAGGFEFLRPWHPHHDKLIRGLRVRQLAGATLVFREPEVTELCGKLRRRVRRKIASCRKGGTVGRPAVKPAVQSCIRELIDAGKWRVPQSIKQLTHLVKRALHRSISEDTVARALDETHAATLDRRFLRHRRMRKKRESAILR